MQRSDDRGLDELIARASNGITRWVLGVGFLSLHATVFFIALVGLVLWNLYDAPTDLWALDIVRRWGALLAVHALAVGVGCGAWRLLRAEQRAIEQNARASWSAVQPTQPYAPVANGTGWQNGAPASRIDRYRAGATQADEMARRLASTTVVWSSRMAQRTRAAVTQAGNRMGAKSGETDDQRDPTTTWPQPTGHQTESEDFIARFAPANGHTPAGQTPASNGNGHGPNGDAPGAGIGKEAGWTWAEAAADPWLGRRERDEHHRTEPAGADGATPPSPPPAGETGDPSSSTPA